MAPVRKKMVKAHRKRTFTTKVHYEPDDESSVSDASDMVDDDYGDRAFLLEYKIDPTDTTNRRRKQKKKDDEEEEDEMEQQHRASDNSKDDGKKLQFLLPVKSDSGVQLRYREVDQDLVDEQKSQKKTKKEQPSEVPKPREESKFAPFSTDVKWKQRVASACYNILENPESNMRHVKELLSGLAEDDIDVAEAKSVIIMASLTEVFKDILPGYRIHVAGEGKTEQKLKKETIKLRSHEEALLSAYRTFLQQLEKATMALYKKNEVGEEEQKRAEMAVRCLSELAVTHSEFNYRKNVIATLVHITTSRFPAPVEKAVDAIRRVVKLDNQGDVTCDVLGAISKVAKTKGHRLSPLLLEVFLNIKVNKDLLAAAKKDKAAKPDRKLLSKKEQKQKKEVAKLERELQVSQVEENKKSKSRLHSQIVTLIFAIYFRILRSDKSDKVRRRLLPSVLKGVVKFVFYISVEYVDGLVKLLFDIVEDGDCRGLEKLLCIQTVFKALSGDGSALNIDPHRFYEHLFVVLEDLDGSEGSAVMTELLHCVHIGFVERKRLISSERAARCAKGLASLALRLCRPQESLAVMLMLRTLFSAHPTLDRFLDADCVTNATVPGQESSSNQPLWQLHILADHYNPAVRAAATAVLGNPKVLHNKFPELLKGDPIEALSDFSSDFVHKTS
ncbi:hypothetical protein RvY_09481 [Ramazzottius varieornatus]|uniref:NOC3-like protein n=1 Tax=Ramazzottius varieornatus TaxID=947166 RepID=A0A1D1VIL2_RAMVA|nr:hypothetical protein RvY_09481 [Ramazzottius varieornatus]